MKPERRVVRRATESDLPNIERQYGPLDNVGDPFCDTSNLTKIPYNHLLVAEVDGRYAGFLCWHIGNKPFFAPRITRFAHIREVQVMKKFRRQGVGKKLTLYALHRLKALGIRNVFLATAETNKVARRLYESLGFKQYRRQVHYHLRINGSSKNDS
jgi:ribosomal protein S18 acetylase RimI-like enzyme